MGITVGTDVDSALGADVFVGDGTDVTGSDSLAGSVAVG